MATRQEIKEMFRSEVVSAVSGLVDADNVLLTNSDSAEELPRVVYSDVYRYIPVNDASGGPDRRELTGNTVDAEYYHEHEEAVFRVRAYASDEGSLEPIYEAIHTRFGRYQFPAWDQSDLHQHVWRVRVRDVTTVDVDSTERTIRGDSMEIHIAFYREYEDTSGENITTIDQSIEGNEYTTT